MKLTIRACLLINLISIQLAAFAQTPTPTFGKKEGQVKKYETAAGFDTDRDGAIYSAMNLNSGATIVKYSSSGAQVWKSVLTPTASYQDVEIKDLRVDTMRNVFVLAQSPINGRGTKMIIRKYTPKGLLLWEKIERQRGYSYKPRQMRIDGYGNLMITGEYNLPSDNPNYSNQKVFLAKHFGSNGNNAWMKVEYPSPYASELSFRGLTLDPSGNMIVTLGDAANYASAAGLSSIRNLESFNGVR